YPKAKEHELIIAPCIAAKSGHSCPQWGHSRRIPQSDWFAACPLRSDCFHLIFYPSGPSSPPIQTDAAYSRGMMTNVVTPTIRSVIDFYERHQISSQIILAKLKASRGHLNDVAPEESFPHDQDHYGGLDANGALAQRRHRQRNSCGGFLRRPGRSGPLLGLP